MSETSSNSTGRPAPDQVLVDIADYVCNDLIDRKEAYSTARYCLMNSLACAVLALKFPGCARLLGPMVPGAGLASGARVPGTDYQLEPAQAAFNIGVMIRYLDFNDTWLAAEWGHPSDNLGAILATADYISRRNVRDGMAPLTMKDVLTAMIKAHEIQGVLGLENSFNRVGLDHVLLVRVASTAVVTHMLGGSREQVIDAVSNAWIDGGALRCYRHAPNTGSRKSWAAGDACRRAVTLALLVLRGEMGYPSALTADVWGFYDVFFKGRSFQFQRSYGSYVMENILFKVAFPAEFHAQTAVECAIALHPEVKNRLGDIERISIETTEAGARIIDKTGPLSNYADRDHCIRYMVAVSLITGGLSAESYSDEAAADPRIDALRDLTLVRENESFTSAYFDPEKRAIANAVQVFFTDGSHTQRVEVAYPLGHRRRRDEGIPLLIEQFHSAVNDHFGPDHGAEIAATCEDQARLESIPVSDFIEDWISR